MLFSIDFAHLMTVPFIQILLIYEAFMGVGTLLALVRRWVRPRHSADSVWKKYPTYFLLNVTFLAAAWLPPSWHLLAVLLAIIGAAASWELSRALGLDQREQAGLLLASAGLILAAEWLSLVIWLNIWLAAILAGVSVTALTAPRHRFGRRLVSLGGCIIYFPICLAPVLWLWHADSGVFYVAFLYLVVATNDAFAQFTGQLIGRHPLAPYVSFAKTVEGAAGGILFALLLGACLSLVTGWSPFQSALMGLLISLAALIGDLTESSWKRALGLKDFSTLLGAQGGVLDRFDSFLFAAPIFFLLINL